MPAFVIIVCQIILMYQKESLYKPHRRKNDFIEYLRKRRRGKDIQKIKITMYITRFR